MRTYLLVALACSLICGGCGGSEPAATNSRRTSLTTVRQQNHMPDSATRLARLRAACVLLTSELAKQVIAYPEAEKQESGECRYTNDVPTSLGPEETGDVSLIFSPMHAQRVLP